MSSIFRLRKPLTHIFVLSLPLLASSIPVHAQQTQSNFLQTNPGLVTPQLEDQRVPVYRQKQLPLAAPVDEVKLETPAAPTAPESQSTVTFNVSHYIVEGNSVFTKEQLEPVITPYENRSVTMKDLRALTDAIMRKYADAGYPTTQVYIPPQELNNGQVNVRIVEGRIGAIEITGNKYFCSKVIASRLSDKPDDLLNIATLEEHLNRINRQMPYHLRATLTPGSETGQTDLKLSVEEAQPWQITPTYDNQGRPGIGTNRLGIGLQNNSLFGYGDRLDLRYIGGVRTNLATASYAVPLNHTGTELGYYYSMGAVHPQILHPQSGQQDADIRGLANNHSLSVSQPLNKDRTLLADLSFNARRVTTKVNGDRVSQDDVRSLSLGLTYNKPDRYGQSFARLQSDVGFKWLGGNQRFWKSQAFLNRTFQLPRNNFILLRGSAQISSDALPPVEEYQLGGAFSVRGFSEGLLIGDKGYNASAEWRWPIPGLVHASPWLAQRVQGAVFYDMGQVWFDSSHRGTYSNNAKRTLLMGTGLGIRAQLTRFLVGFVDFGYGISNQHTVEPNAQPSVRVHFGIRSDLLPKNYISRGNNVTYFNPRPTVMPTVKTK